MNYNYTECVHFVHIYVKIVENCVCVYVPEANGNEAIRASSTPIYKIYLCTLMTCPNACYFIALVFTRRYHRTEIKTLTHTHIYISVN